MTHSEKALETLRLLGCDTNGWDLVPIRWETVTRAVPTRVSCPTCHGWGQVSAATLEWPHAMTACPTCPRSRRSAAYGTGEVWQLVEREVHFGVLVWPEGTRHRVSRFAGDGCHCELCGKRIDAPSSWRPMLGHDAAGTPIALWTGDECARKLFGVAKRDLTMVVAAGEAAVARAEARVWRELPKPPKPPKPVKPAIPPQLSRAEAEALGRAIAGDRFVETSLSLSRAQGRLGLLVQRPNTQYRDWIFVSVDARFGAKLAYGYNKPVWKDRSCQSLREALVANTTRIQEWVRR